jgi:hypothetical protein
MSVLNILNMLHDLRFSLCKCRLFHNATLFGSCIIHILNTGVLKFKRKFWRQRVNNHIFLDCYVISFVLILDLVAAIARLVYTYTVRIHAVDM